MNTKEAIQNVKDKYEGWMGYANSQKEVDELGKERDEVIELLQRGEKFEVIVDELENDYGFLGHRYMGSDSIDYLRYIIPRLKQKYFPKGGEPK